MNFLIYSLAFIYGAIIGSFLNVLIWRLPRESGLGGRSACPNCHHSLIWLDLIPVFSYLAQGRKCRYCHNLISPRYATIEIITAILFFLAVTQVWPVGIASMILLLKILFVISVCIVVFAIDLEHYLILDKVVYPATIVVGIAAIYQHLFWGNLLSGILAALPFFLIWYFSDGKWMGLGDVKFLVFMGLTLGFPSIIVALFLAFTIGGVIGVALIVAGKKHLSSKLPFGTFLTGATIIALFFGPQLWEGYWHLFGL